jgi:hypothetical protein
MQNVANRQPLFSKELLMSVDSELTRIPDARLQQCLENPDPLWDILYEDFDDGVCLAEYADHPAARTILIGEHDLSMLAHLSYGDSLFEHALLLGQHVVETGDSALFYLTPVEVSTTAAALRRVTDGELRAQAAGYPGGLSVWIGDQYPTEAALLAHQKACFDLVVAFYDRAAAAGDAVIIRYG